VYVSAIACIVIPSFELASAMTPDDHGHALIRQFNTQT
jgi:hypothetical protein